MSAASEEYALVKQTLLSEFCLHQNKYDQYYGAQGCRIRAYVRGAVVTNVTAVGDIAHRACVTAAAGSENPTDVANLGNLCTVLEYNTNP